VRVPVLLVLPVCLAGCAIVHSPHGTCAALLNARCTAAADGSYEAKGAVSETTWAGFLATLVTAAGAAYAIGH